MSDLLERIENEYDTVDKPSTLSKVEPLSVDDVLAEEPVATITSPVGTVEEQPKVEEPVSSSISTDSTDRPLPSVSQPTTVFEEPKVEVQPEDMVVAQPDASKPSPLDVLKNITFSIDSIEFTDEANTMDRSNDIESIFDVKETFQVVAVQSAYKAHMSALSMQDINSIINSSEDAYSSRKKLYQIIYNHIEGTSVGKMNFTDWCKVTSYHDVETLLYGIYCQTFPEKNEFTLTCGECESENKVTVNHDTLITTFNEVEFRDKMFEILKTIKSLDDVRANSMVSKITKSILPKSKLLVEFCTPSLHDHLELLRSTNASDIERYGESIGSTMFIKSIAVINIDATVKAGKPIYHKPLTARNDIFNLIVRLSYEDGKEFQATVNERARRYGIEYKIRKFHCANCNAEFPETPVSIEKLLFTKIVEDQKA